MTEEDKKTICEMFNERKINSRDISEELGIPLVEVNDFLGGVLRPANRDGGKPQMTGAKTFVAK